MQILTTPRLLLRELVQADYAALCRTLQDAQAMTAYEHAFSAEEVQAWLDRQLERYRVDGFGLWAVLLRETGVFAGQCGLTMQDWNGRHVLEAGYLFERAHWRHGYATEASAACISYAFEHLGANEVFSIIRDTNLPSQAVARRNGMTLRGEMCKHYYGIDMPHFIYSVRAAEWARRGAGGSSAIESPAQ